MSSYRGRHAELYDLFYAAKPYLEEAAFVHQCLQRYSVKPVHRLLELACGTGSHAFALEKFEYQILATDDSEDMLAQARLKASQNSSAVQFGRQDMTALDVPGGPFDAVVCLFDSIGYVATNDAVRRVLQGVYRSLRPGGLFAFEFWHAAAMLRHHEPVRVRRWRAPRGEIIRISETRLECEKQLGSVTYSIYELFSDGTYSSLTETQVNRYFLIQEMAALLESCGLMPLRWFSGYRDDQAIDENTWHVVALAARNDARGLDHLNGR